MKDLVSVNSREEIFSNKKIITSYFLCILVFWIHCSSFANYEIHSTIINSIRFLIQDVIALVAVPLFFVISGVMYFATYNPKVYLQKLRRRIVTLVIPYFSWNIINMIFEMFSSSFFSKYYIGRQKMQITIKNILLGIFYYKYNPPFWYIFCLIVFAIVAPLLYILIHNKYIGFLSILVVTILCAYDIELPHIFYDRTSIVYYLIGCYIGRHYYGQFSTESKKRDIILSYFVAIFIVLIAILTSRSGIELPNVARIGLLSLSALATWNIMTSICEVIHCRDYMKHSFWVYALHMNVGGVIAKVTYLVLPKHEMMSIINFAITTIGTLFVIEWMYRILKKYMPAVCSLLDGNR